MRKLGDYTIEGPLGAGGMGVVLRGRAPDGRAVAIKIVQRPSDEIAARFARERRLLASFGFEEGFVPLIDAGEVPQGPYIVMPLIEGGTLRDRFGKGQKLPLDEALAVGRQIVAAVARAHERGVVHRDLKPENVLFAERDAKPPHFGRPLVADLGLAKHFRREDLGGSKSVSLTGANEFKGTMNYMAVEQMKDARSVGPPADVFSLGAILYESLAGHPPFQSDDVLELINAVALGIHVPLRRVRRDVPPWLEAAIEKALRPDPDERWNDAHELLLALRGGGAASKVSPALAVAGVVLAGALVAVVLGVGSRRPPAPPPPPQPPRPPVIGSATTTTSPTVDSLLLVIRERYDRKDWRGVIEAAEQAIQLDHELMKAWAFLAEAHQSLGEYEKAVAEYDVIVNATPDSMLAHLGRGKCRYNLRRWPETIEDLDKAIALGGSREGMAFEMRGIARQKLGDAAGAVADLDEALALGVTTANVYGDRGRALLALGRRKEAIDDLSRAIAQEPGRDDLHANRGIAHRELGQYRESIADFDAAIKVAAVPSATYHANRGASLLEVKEVDAAKVALERAIAIDGGDAFTWTTLGRVFEALKDEQGAYDAYTKGIAAQPDKPWCYVNRANIRIRRSDFEGAKEDATKAIAVDEKMAAAYIARGNARLELKDFEGSIADHTKAIDLGLALGWKNRASARRAAGDLEGAVADVEKFIEVTPPRAPDDPIRFVLRSLKAELRQQQESRGR